MQQVDTLRQVALVLFRVQESAVNLAQAQIQVIEAALAGMGGRGEPEVALVNLAPALDIPFIPVATGAPGGLQLPVTAILFGIQLELDLEQYHEY